MAIELLTLDLDNTLWETDSVIVKAEQACASWVKSNVPAAAQHYNYETLRTLKDQVAEQKPDIAHKVSELRLEILKRIFLLAGLEANHAALNAQQAFAEFLAVRNQVTLFDGALSALEALNKEFQLIALSNGNSDLSQIGIDHLFDAHFSADHVARPKPFPDMFEAAFLFANKTAAQGIHIGDHQQQDILAAQQLGMKTVWVNVDGQTWQEEKQPHATVTHLSQLADAIQALR